MAVLAGARIGRGRHLLLAATVSAAALVAGVGAFPEQAAAQSRAERRIDVAIPAQDLNSALLQFTQRADLQIVYTDDKVAGRRSAAVEGRFTPVEALSRMLAGTGLTFRFTGANRVTLEPAPQMSDSSAIQLGPVRVEGAAGTGSSALPPSISSDPSATEGSGSYTAESTNSATGLRLSLRETPQSVSVFTRARIDDQALNEVSELLEQTVGISYVPRGALGSDGVNFYSRGFEVQNFQVDGVSRQSTIFGFQDATADLAVYDRLEVIRGATGLLSGVGTPGATVNFVRKKPTPYFQAHLAGQVGSWDRYRVEADVSGPLSASGDIRGRIVAAYQQSDWFTARSHSEKFVVYGIVEADLTDSTLFTLGAQYQRFENDGSSNFGLPLFFSDGSKANLPRHYNSGSAWSEMTNSDMMIFAGLEQDLGSGWNAKLDGEYSRPKYDSTFGGMYATTIDPVTGAGGTFYTTRWAADLEQWSTSLRLSGPFELLGRSHELMLGGSYSRGSDNGPLFPGWYGAGAATNQFPIPDAIAYLETGEVPRGNYEPTGGRFGGHSEQLAAYASTRLNLHDRVKVILGARLTNWIEKSWDQAPGEGRIYELLTRDKGVFTPYGGVTIDLTDNLTVYASYTDIFNPQNYEDANGDRLNPLEGANYEAGLKADFYDGRLNASLAVFKIEQDNFALAIPGQLTPSGSQAYEAVSGTESKGVELEVSGEVLPDWQIAGGYSYTKVEDRDGQPLTTYAPRDSVKLFTSYRFSGPLQDLVVGGNMRWQGRSYVDDAGPNGETFTQDALITVDLMAQYPVLPQLTLSLNVNNVFDKTYFAGHNFIGVYGTPRQALLNAKYSF